MIKEVKKYITHFFLFAFIGWIWEILLNLLTRHELINPGTLIGPWLPIYGCGMLLIILISKKVNNKYLLFIISFFTFGIIEYTTSLYLDCVYNKRWWDYSNFLLNINGRVSIEALTFFSLLGVLSVKFILPKIEYIYKKNDNLLFTIILILLLILYIIDFVYSTFNNYLII